MFRFHASWWQDISFIFNIANLMSTSISGDYVQLIFLFLFFLRYMNRYFIFSWAKSEMGDSFKFVIFNWNKISRFIFTVIRMADFHYDMTDSISYSCIFVYLSFYRIFDLILLCFDIPSRRF